MGGQDMPRMEYKLIEAWSSAELKQQASELCADGWIPSGSPFMFEFTNMIGGNRIFFMQSFVRPFREEHE